MASPTPPKTNGVAPAETQRRRRNAQSTTENAIVASTRTLEERRVPEREAPKAERRDDAAQSQDSAKRPAGDAERIRFERMPERVQDRYYNIDKRWFLDNGEEAFVNHGDRLTTKSENRQIVRDLIEIARENGAEAITVTGTETFRRTAWREAQRFALRVEGFEPTQHDEKQLVRQMARERAAERGTGSERRAGSEREAPESIPAPDRTRRAPRGRAASSVDSEAERGVDEPSGRRAATARPLKDRFYYGELVEHGAENYQGNPQEDISYYVKLATSTGVKELWGKDLERALQESKSRPRVGDQIGVRQTGRRSVTVQEREFDDAGNLVGKKDKETHRNEWLIEKREFFDERTRIADTVRDSTVSVREAVKRHPQLAGTEVLLKEAEEGAKKWRNPATRAAFLATVRKQVADEIARGEPFRTTRVRTPEARAAARTKAPPERAAERTQA